MSKPKRKNSEKAKSGNRSNPRYPLVYLIFYLFGVTGIVASFVLSLNWNRLRKPRWVVKSLFFTVGLPVLNLLMVASFWSLISTQPIQVAKNLAVFVGVSTLLTLYILPLSLVWLQFDGYRFWRANGSEGLAEYNYPTRHTNTVSLLTFLGLSLVIAFAVNHFMVLPSYSNDFYRFEYHRDWILLEDDNFDFCHYQLVSNKKL